MHKPAERTKTNRQGAMTVFVAVLLVPLMALVALAVDYGFLVKKRIDLQRAADAAVLAAIRDMVPDEKGRQDLNLVRETVRKYAALNMKDDGFKVLGSDIEFGQFDPATVYSDVKLTGKKPYDTLRVTLRYDSKANSPVSLFFAQAFGLEGADVRATATAVLQKTNALRGGLGVGSNVLPFVVHEDVWNSMNKGDIWNIYSDGRILDEFGSPLPGNWGTCDIGDSNNSATDLKNQILNGLSQADLDGLYAEGRISSSNFIDSKQTVWLNGNTGISSGMKSAVEQIYGQTRIVPIYRSVGPSAVGEKVEYEVVAWGVVKVVTSNWGGSDTYIQLYKSTLFGGEPQKDLGGTGAVDGVYSSPVLVQ